MPLPARLAWDDVRLFLAVSRHRSAHQTGLRLGISHSTVLRRIAAFESEVEGKLFSRAGASLAITELGQRLLPFAEEMERAALGFEREIDGNRRALSGELRILASEGLGTYWLMPGTAEFLRQHPGLRANFILYNSNFQKFDYKDAVCVTWWRPDEPSVVARKLGEIRYSLFTTAGYEARLGVPASWDELAHHRTLHFNAYDANPGFAAWTRFMEKHPPVWRVESSISALPLMKTDNFVTLMPDYTDMIAPEFRRAPFDTGIRLEVWVAYHENDRRNPAITGLTREIVRLAGESRGTWLAA